MEEKLIESARRAAQRSYAPYSGFSVGAALLADDGSIYPGCNVESAAFGATICAERAALASAVTDGKTSFRMLAVYTDTDEPTSPCGICRQMLMEFSPEMVILSACRTGRIRRWTLADLLPEAFSESQIKKS